MSHYNPRTAPVIVEDFTVYPDGSAVIAMVSCGGIRFSAGYVNHKAQLSRVGFRASSPVDLKIAVRRCETEFGKRLATPEWQALHTAMYSAA